MASNRIAGLLLSLSLTSHASETARITLDSGDIIGSVGQGVETFKGIPYAAPPIGKRRWQPPYPVVPWSEPRQTKNYGKACLSGPLLSDAAPATEEFSEDCLTLNVWRPTYARERLPVMVWINGGDVNHTSSSDTGAAFARQGIVFVSVNYRLGRFGLFAHPALANQPLRGNYGLMDQIAALKWVQRNIAAFEGDAGNVTLFGESTGRFAVVSLLTTDLSKGLFHKAIIQSGSGRDTLSAHQDWAHAEQDGIAFAKALGITGEDQQALDALRALPAALVASGRSGATLHPLDETGPIIDGEMITREPRDRFRQGEFHYVPLMIGTQEANIGFAPLATSADTVRLQRDWIHFARSGQPTGANLPWWNTYHAGRDNLLLIPAAGSLTPTQSPCVQE